MKRLISILLAVMLVASCTVVTSAYSWGSPKAITVDQAIAEYEATTGKKVATNRYYFLMPNGSNGDKGSDGNFAPSWYNEMSETAGIYWWNSGIADPESWIGYLPSGVDESDPNIYYADVPQAATSIVWNNGFDRYKETDPKLYYSARSINIACKYYDVSESENYPDGTDSFDNMIFVIDPDLVSIHKFSLKQTCGGEWYYYYGNGCYGFTKDGTKADCLRDDHYNAAGNHVHAETDSQYIIAGADETDPSNIKGTVHGYMGDADGDSESSVMDATEIQLCIAHLKIMDETHSMISDVDRDGELSVMDATEIQLFIAKLKTSDIIGRILYTPISTESPTEKPSIRCDECNITVLNPYSYGSYDELCYSCYADIKNSYHPDRCDNCGTYSNPYHYDGYDLCVDCYYLYKNPVKCYNCWNSATSFYYVEISGSYKCVCYSCYYN